MVQVEYTGTRIRSMKTIPFVLSTLGIILLLSDHHFNAMNSSSSEKSVCSSTSKVVSSAYLNSLLTVRDKALRSLAMTIAVIRIKFRSISECQSTIHYIHST